LTVDEISILISASAEQAIAQLDQVALKIGALAGGGSFTLHLDTAQAEEKLAALRRTANQLLTDLDGGQTTATALAQAQNNYKSAISTLQTLKSLSRTTYEQELEYLTAIRDSMERYSLSAQDALDLEKRLLDVQAEIAARDAESLDTLLDGILSALTNRYETMRDAELAILGESREAWEDWQESSTDAIQAQIDALDALTEAEDRAAQEEGYVRTIEKLQQALAYEQNDYNRAQLTAQLADAQAEYEAWLTQTAREDEKAALTAQLAAVAEKTQAELEALDEQADAINAAYDERLQAAALEAEAEKLLMNGTQEELLDLIASYAPDYNAAGQTLGEQLLAGFVEKVGSVEGWTDTLNESIAAVQESLNAAMQEAADAFYGDHAASAAGGITLIQQNTFNTPVETPAETALRIGQANEALAAQLLEA
jgi:hypothetical protein